MAKSQYTPSDLIGNRYQVHKALRGGMGEVYLCLDMKEMNPCALKTFQKRYQSRLLRDAFEAEVATWIALEKHPNIVRCHHMSTLDNQPFMILEWVAGVEGKGTDLQGWLRHGALDMQTSLEVTIDIVRGLIHAQRKQPGLVHRDLKPGNILLTQEGVAKVTDFGLAQIVQTAQLTVTSDEIDEKHGRQTLIGKGDIVGTPTHMAPEQWRNELLDERTDIYAIGCILYEMVSGYRPFQASFTQAGTQKRQQWLRIMKQLHEESPPKPLPDELPLEVKALVYRCLAKTQRKRPAHLAELMLQLSELYQHNFQNAPPKRPVSGTFSATDYHNRGTTYRVLKQYEKALVDSNQAVSLEPAQALFYVSRGNVYHDLEQYGLALEDYNFAIDLDGNLAEAYGSRGNTYHSLEQYKATLADYERAIELDPHNALNYANRGNTYQTMGQYSGAVKDYTTAINLDFNLVTAYVGRGVSNLALAQHEAALNDLTRAIALDPNNSMAHSNRGLTYHNLAQFEEALEDYNHAIDLEPKTAKYYFNRGLTYQFLEHYDAALNDYEQTIALDPSLAETYNNRGAIYYSLEQYELALNDLNYAIALNPNYSQSHFTLGILLMEMNNMQEALSHFETAAQLGHPHGTQYFAQVREMLGIPPTPEPASPQRAYNTFQATPSLDAMRDAVAAHPLLAMPHFIADIEQIIAQQVPPDQHPYFEQRLGWLRQIAQEQNQ